MLAFLFKRNVVLNLIQFVIKSILKNVTLQNAFVTKCKILLKSFDCKMNLLKNSISCKTLFAYLSFGK